MNKLVGIVLCVVGGIGLIWGGFTYHTQQTIFAVGPVHATRDAAHTVPITPLLGGLLLLVGIVCLAAGRGKSA